MIDASNDGPSTSDHATLPGPTKDTTSRLGVSLLLRDVRACVKSTDAKLSDVGAASAKMLFADRFTGIDLEVSETSIAGGGDDRLVGVCVSGIRIDGQRCDDRLQFDEGFHGRVEHYRSTTMQALAGPPLVMF